MVLWCGLLTICVLRRNLHIHHWVGICMIAAGSMLVIASSVLDDDPSQETEDHSMVRKESVVAEFPLIGAGVVMFGQLMSAVQVALLCFPAYPCPLWSVCPQLHPGETCSW